MVVLVMDQYSSVLKSSWHSTHFWSPQEQVKVKIESEDVHIQVLTKSVASSLFRAFAAFFWFQKNCFWRRRSQGNPSCSSEVDR